MAEKIKRIIPLCIVLILIIGIVVGGSLIYKMVRADVIPVEVIVGNAPPTWTIYPVEDPASSSAFPTNVGDGITFRATASDPNLDNYFLAICKTNVITPGTGGGAPICPDGHWCISASTADDAIASCPITTVAGPESNAWFAFVCDAAATGQACSPMSQGTGDPGSPFFVNHRPAFTAITLNPAADPGGTVIWTATSTDPDIDTIPDTVKLIVCDGPGFDTATDACIGTQLCASGLVASNPSCSFTIPTPRADATYAAWVYVVDNHGFEAAGAVQNTNAQYTVNNVAPIVTDVRLNNELDITLGETATTTVLITGKITDNNLATDIVSGIARAYRSGIGFAGCTIQNDNNCYFDIACVLDVAGAFPDVTRNATCTAVFQFIADPTVTTTPWAVENWLATLVGEDNNAATGSAETALAVEVMDLIALGVVPGNIAYGLLLPGQTIDPLTVTSTIQATGNVSLDTDISGTDMTCTTVPANIIAVGNQRYATSTVAHAAGIALTTLAVELELNVPKSTSTVALSGRDTFWGLHIPDGTPVGTYAGNNTFIARTNEVAEW